MAKKKILITGSCGFIYSNFIRRIIFNKHPYEIVSIDKLTNSKLKNNIYFNKNHQFYLGDICDTHLIDKIFEFERPDIVLHTAAESAVDYSLQNPNAFINSNVLGTQIVINASIKYGVKKFIYQSTDEVYGALTSEKDMPWTESSSINPRNPYSASKAAGEMLVNAAHNAHGLQYIILRTSNNYGPRQMPDKLIPRVIKCILNNEKIPVYGQGSQIRDWTYVGDNCDAVLKIIESDRINEVFNISSNQEYSNIEVVNEICNVIGKGHDLITFIKDPRGNAHDFRYSVDSKKTRLLGWKPEVKFKETGLKDTVDWYIANSYWFN